MNKWTAIGLGANLGDPIQQIGRAAQTILQRISPLIWHVSPLIETPPAEGAEGPSFWNAVLILQTKYSAKEILHALQDIEQEAGRLRPFKNAPRSLDLDLLFHRDQVIDQPDLCCPHPRWNKRIFVLYPLAKINPNLIIHGASTKDWLTKIHPGPKPNSVILNEQPFPQLEDTSPTPQSTNMRKNN